MRKRAPKNLTIDLGGDLLDSLTEWSSRRDNNKSFDDWTEFWRAKELSMLHHAPYILDNCPKNILLSIYDILAAELSSPALRIGAVFALYTFYHTQPEPLHATKQRALGKDEIDWRVQIPITPTNATHLLQLRRQLVEEQRSENEDLLEILRRLADCVEVSWFSLKRLVFTDAADDLRTATTASLHGGGKTLSRLDNKTAAQSDHSRGRDCEGNERRPPRPIHFRFSLFDLTRFTEFAACSRLRRRSLSNRLDPRRSSL